MVRAAWALAVGAALLLPSAARAQDSRWEQQVRGQLERDGKQLTDRGYEQTHELYTGALDEGASEYVTLTLHKGTAYAVLGVCDEDCSDIDLKLYDADGNEVDSDTESDDYPVVKAAPDETAKYRVKVIMVSCKTSPCFYGLGVWGK